MTRILFLIDSRSLYVIEKPETPDQLAEEINSASPPAWAEAIAGEALQGRRLRPVRLGEDLAVIPAEIEQVSPIAQPVLGGSERLTARELQVLQGMAEGLTTKAICLRLGLRPRTVTHHIASIKTKFGVSTRGQSVGRGVLLGLCKLPEGGCRR
ncbi:MAG: LuxR C-terminal-related transcriptional regulator [Chloroflexi bacterium]|nr:LuxR C-terminal-related transcriptional regulator [Chloroflexota bacterium]